MDTLSAISTRLTPQSRRAAADQSPNSAGGYTFTLDDAARLRRFLILGVDGGTYYTSAQDLAIDNLEVLERMAAEAPRTLVDTIVEVSTSGAAPRQNPALFALAYATSVPQAREDALAALPRVVRTGSHLFTFATYVQQFRGWGRGLRRAVGRWYTDRQASDLAYQVVKYRQRDGWTHRDLLRLSHPVTPVPELRSLFDWIVRRSVDDDTPELIRVFLRAQEATKASTWAGLVREHRLTWEMLPDAALREPEVWEALLEAGIPQTALLRQLPRLTGLGLLSDLGGHTEQVCAQLTDPGRLRKARVHPVKVLVAARTYASGQSVRGKSSWQPSRGVVDALDEAFYASFGAVVPSGKRTMLALDVSGSMASYISGLPVTAREASAGLALVQLATEPDAEAYGFSSAGGWYKPALTPLGISPRRRLDDALAAVSSIPMGGTDCALPMLHAIEQGLEVDTFVIYTDNETWYGKVHPHQALRRYRECSGIDARLIVVGMTSTGFSIADPDDPGMLDVVGFDAAVPSLITEFARGF